jgi:hypothetical protein
LAWAFNAGRLTDHRGSGSLRGSNALAVEEMRMRASLLAVRDDGAMVHHENSKQAFRVDSAGRTENGAQAGAESGGDLAGSESRRLPLSRALLLVLDEGGSRVSASWAVLRRSAIWETLTIGARPSLWSGTRIAPAIHLIASLVRKLSPHRSMRRRATLAQDCMKWAVRGYQSGPPAFPRRRESGQLS